jgi:hypothetical protein
MVHAIPSMLDASAGPLSRVEIRADVGGRDEDVRAAVRVLLGAGTSEPMDVVEVGKRVRGAHKLWTRQRAEVACMAIVPRMAADDEGAR